MEKLIVVEINPDAPEFFLPFIPADAWALAGERPCAGLGLMLGEASCGALLFALEDGEMEILSLMVHPDLRGQGGGTRLMKAALDLAELFEVRSVKAGYLTASGEEALRLGKFFQHFGFAPPDLWQRYYTTTLGELQKAAFFAGDTPGAGVPLSELDEAALGTIWDAPVSLPLSLARHVKDLCPEFSYALFDGPRLLGYVLVTERPDETYHIAAACSFLRSGNLTLRLLRAVGAALFAACPPEAEVQWVTVNPRVDKLVAAVIRGCRCVREDEYVCRLTVEPKSIRKAGGLGGLTIS